MIFIGGYRLVTLEEILVIWESREDIRLLSWAEVIDFGVETKEEVVGMSQMMMPIDQINAIFNSTQLNLT